MSLPKAPTVVRVIVVSVWDLLCSVRFAVVQIALLCVAGVIGAVLEQLPTYATRDAQGYVTEMARIRVKYQAVDVLGVNVGPSMTNLFESLGFFRVFSSPWFLTMLTILALSIAVCTVNKLPKLWRDARRVRVDQPAPFFDPRLANRARLERGSADVATVHRALRRNGFRRPSISDPGAGVVSLYGAKNQYAKLATLLTHTGLILFLAAGAVTSATGFETVVFLGDGQSAPVQPVGTPRNLLVRNIRFDAPQRPDGSFADFWTDVAVYREGQQALAVRPARPGPSCGNRARSAVARQMADRRGRSLFTKPAVGCAPPTTRQHLVLTTLETRSPDSRRSA